MPALVSKPTLAYPDLESHFPAEGSVAEDRTGETSRRPRSEEEMARETALRDILQVISKSRHDELPVFDMILENASRLCHSPMAALVLVNDERTHYGIAADHGAKPEMLKFLAENPPPLDPERFVAARAMVEMRAVHVDDLADPVLYGASDRIRIQTTVLEGIRTSLFVPLISGGAAIGSIALWRRVVLPFTDDEIALVETFAEQAIIAIDNVRQFKALEERTREVQALNAGLESRVAEQVTQIERMSRLRRFLSPAVADTVIQVGEEAMLRSHRAFIAILFADLRGFTAFCEAAEPAETIDVLSTYHEAMGDLLRVYGAGVDQRAGDGIMAVFNDPVPCEKPAHAAVSMALAMRSRMQTLCDTWLRRGHRLGFGVGISLGHATVGMVGAESRYEYIAAGTATNVAARLCDEASDGEILLSPRAMAEVDGAFETESAGQLNLKGIRKPVDVHRVLAPRAA